MNISHKLNLTSRIFKSIFFNQMPNYAVIFIDGRCNMHCGFCCHAAMDARKTPIISAQKWGEVFKDAKSLLQPSEHQEKRALVAARIGNVRLIDNGEIDHKLIAVQKNSALFSVNTITELDEEFPGVSKIIETWFANYKGKGKIKTNGFAGVEVSMTMLRESVNEFKKNNK